MSRIRAQLGIIVATAVFACACEPLGKPLKVTSEPGYFYSIDWIVVAVQDGSKVRVIASDSEVPPGLYDELPIRRGAFAVCSEPAPPNVATVEIVEAGDIFLECADDIVVHREPEYAPPPHIHAEITLTTTST